MRACQARRGGRAGRWLPPVPGRLEQARNHLVWWSAGTGTLVIRLKDKGRQRQASFCWAYDAPVVFPSASANSGVQGAALRSAASACLTGACAVRAIPSSSRHQCR